jgi:hypothetical protein
MRSKMSSILKPYFKLVLLWVACMGRINQAHAQLIGTEQSVSKTVFKGEGVASVALKWPHERTTRYCGTGSAAVRFRCEGVASAALEWPHERTRAAAGEILGGVELIASSSFDQRTYQNFIATSIGPTNYQYFQYIQAFLGFRSLYKTLSFRKLENLTQFQTAVNELGVALKDNGIRAALATKDVQATNKFIDFINEFRASKIIRLGSATWKDEILNAVSFTGAKRTAFEMDLDILESLFNTNTLTLAQKQKYAELWDFARSGYTNITASKSYAFRSIKILKLLNKYDAFPNLKNWIATLDHTADAALINKLDALATTNYATLNTEINALKATFEANSGTVKAWEVAFKHADLIRLDDVFLKNLATNLDDFPNLKLDLQDIDVFNAYKEFGSDKVLAYEILNNVDGNLAVLVAQKVQTSTVPSYWKYLVKGKYFERDFLLAKFKDRFLATVPDEYIRLRNKATAEFGIDLNLYDMYSQVQFNLPSSVTLPSGRILDYFVADQVFIKWKTLNGQNVIEDMLIIENKLSDATALTPPQNAGKAASSLKVRSQNATNESPVSGIALPKDLSININNKWLKAFDSDNGDILTEIKKL